MDPRHKGGEEVAGRRECNSQVTCHLNQLHACSDTARDIAVIVTSEPPPPVGKDNHHNTTNIGGGQSSLPTTKVARATATSKTGVEGNNNNQGTRATFTTTMGTRDEEEDSLSRRNTVHLSIYLKVFVFFSSLFIYFCKKIETYMIIFLVFILIPPSFPCPF